LYYLYGLLGGALVPPCTIDFSQRPLNFPTQLFGLLTRATRLLGLGFAIVVGARLESDNGWSAWFVVMISLLDGWHVKLDKHSFFYGLVFTLSNGLFLQHTPLYT
jgi:hypothetical protein